MSVSPSLLNPVRAVFLCIALFAASVHAANEAALLELWKQHVATPDDHEAVIKACDGFLAANPADPLLPVVHGIEAWHKLRAGRTQEALRLIVPYLSAAPGPVNDGGRMLAMGWMTRLDREKVVAALQLYYRKEVAYPKTLEPLGTETNIPIDARPPLTDRFGSPWAYRLVGFARAAGFTNQKYSLQSPMLGDLSDFKTALKIPYGSRINAVPVQVLPAGSTVAVKFNLGGKGGVAAVGLGQNANDLHLAYVGSQIVVVCDYTHWKIFPKP